MGDLTGFQLKTLGALQNTRADIVESECFAHKVPGADGLISGYNDTSKARLQATLDVTIMCLCDDSHSNLLHGPEFDPGHPDAIGSVFSSVGYEPYTDKQIYDAEDTPMSYPFPWNISQLGHV